MKKKRIAIAGCTGHVVKFGQLINSFEESETVAVWDRETERGRKVAEELNCPFVEDYDDLLSEYHPDAVAIIAENSFKPDLIIKAANQGISVFVEKPMCVNPCDAYAIRCVIKKNNVKFFMTDPFVRKGLIKIKELIKEGCLGEVREANFRIGQKVRPENMERMLNHPELYQGGIMADVGGHAIHMAHYLFGKPESLSAVLTYENSVAEEKGIENKAVITMVYPQQLTAVLECSWVSVGKNDRAIVYGTKASAEVVKLSNTEGDESVAIYRNDGSEIITEFDHTPVRHIRYFVEMLVNDYDNSIVGVDPHSNSGVSIDNAVEFVEIIDAIYRSTSDGRMVSL